LFLAPDAELLENAVDQATRLEAIEDLRDDSQQTADLSDEQLQELRDREDEARGLLGESVRNVYRHLFYVEDNGLTHVTITSVDAGGGTKLVDAVRTTLEDMNRIIRDDDQPKGKVWFEQKLWQSQKRRMTTADLEGQFARKPGLPFLLSTKPLRKTIARMVSDHEYAYWDSERERLTGTPSPSQTIGNTTRRSRSRRTSRPRLRIRRSKSATSTNSSGESRTSSISTPTRFVRRS